MVMKILIADDSKLIRERLIKLLSGYKDIDLIEQAGNVSETIDRFNKILPNVVILDIQMPDGTGMDVLKTIEDNKYSPTVIILTNHPYPSYRKSYIEAGADYFFDKSTEFTKVKEVFNNLFLTGMS
jgi:DNA-binding NarL/FixJ family response regulator